MSAKRKIRPPAPKRSPNSDDFDELRKQRKRLLKWGVILLALLSAAIPLAWWGYGKFRLARLDRHLASAVAAAQREDWEQARSLARSVLLVRKADSAAARLWRRASLELGGPQAAGAAMGILFEDAEASVDDRMGALAYLAKEGPLGWAFAGLRKATVAERESAAGRMALGHILERQGREAEAIRLLKEAVAADGDPRLRLDLIRLHCRSRNTLSLFEARTLLEDLIVEGANPEALEAIGHLGSVPGGLEPWSSGVDLEQWVTECPDARPEHHLAALQPRLERDPVQRDKLIDEAVARWATAAPVPVATWLLKFGRADQAVDCLRPEKESSSDAYIAYVHALRAADRLEDAVEAVRSAPAVVDPVEAGLLRMTVGQDLNDAELVEQGWSEAMLGAAYSEDSNGFVDLAQKAFQLRDRDKEADAWVAAIRLGWGKIPLSPRLMPVIGTMVHKDRGEDLLEMFMGLQRFEIGNPWVQLNQQYLAMLYGRATPESSVGILRELKERDVEGRLPVRSRLAMALLMSGRVEECLKLIESSGTSTGDDSSRIEAVFAVANVLVGGGDQDALDALPLGELLGIERSTLEGILVEAGHEEVELPSLAVDAGLDVTEDVAAWRSALEKMEDGSAGEGLPPLPGMEEKVAPPVDVEE